MKDKYGHEYSELTALQMAQLRGIWSDRLVPKLYDAVTDYVLRHNRQANGPEQTHYVLRGQDLVQIIMDWPETKPCYPSPVPEEEIV